MRAKTKTKKKTKNRNSRRELIMILLISFGIGALYSFLDVSIHVWGTVLSIWILAILFEVAHIRDLIEK